MYQYTPGNSNSANLFYVDVVRQGSTRGNALVTFFTTSDGTAIPGVDYGVVTNTVLAFAPGVPGMTAAIPILNNRFASNDVTVVMQLSNANNTVLAPPSQATLLILTTNQAPGQFKFAQPSYTVSEAAGSLTATVLRVNGHHGRVRVDFTTTNASALASQMFVPTNGTLTFEDLETSKSIFVSILETHQVTGNQTFSLMLLNPTNGATLTQPTNATVTIVDDSIGVSFVSPSLVLPETAGNVSMTVSRQNGTNLFTTVQYATTNITAQAGVNYVATSGTITFPPGVSYTNIVVKILHDPQVTGNVQFGVNLFNPSAPARLGPTSSATVVLLDVESGIRIDSTNLVAITNDDLSVTTNASYGLMKSSGFNLPISIVASNINNGALGVTFATADGTAQAGLDYVTNSGVLALGNGIPSQTVHIQIISNQLIEGDRSFTMYLTNATPTNVASLMIPYAATITITDDTAGLAFASPAYTTTENNLQGAVVAVVRNNWTNTAVRVDFSTADGSGVANVNYMPTNGTLFFNPGETVKSFVVLPKDDHIVDGNHTVKLYLSNAVASAGSAVLISPANASLLILETDGSLILPAGVALISESGPVNGVIDPGETVTLLFGLRNANGTNTANLVATLLATNGVANPSGPQTYGTLVAHGPSVSRPFTFTAAATNGQTISAILQLSDGGTVLSNAVFSFTVGKQPVTFANTNVVVINDAAAATPYPSVITINNMNGLVTQGTVSLNGLSHGNPRDIDALLVSPSGQKVLLMSHCGSTFLVNNVNLTFDDTASRSLPQNAQITSGTYLPTAYYSQPPFPPAPAPFPPNATAAPYTTSLSTLNGSSANGSWALYVIDDNPLFSGSIANGWAVNLTLTGPVPASADLALGMSASAGTVVATSNLTYTVFLTNAGPALATNIVVTDTLPAGSALVSSNPSQGSVSATTGVATWNISSLAYGATASLSLTVRAPAGGTMTNSATVTTATGDPNPEDDSASVTTTVIPPTADLALTMTDSPDPVLLGYNLTYTFTVNNLGPASATAVTLVDSLPVGMDFVSASPSGAFSRVGQVVTFNLGTLGSNAQTTATLVVRPTVPGTPLNVASCSSSVTDPFKANNRASVKTIVEQVAMSACSRQRRAAALVAGQCQLRSAKHDGSDAALRLDARNRRHSSADRRPDGGRGAHRPGESVLPAGLFARAGAAAKGLTRGFELDA